MDVLRIYALIVSRLQRDEQVLRSQRTEHELEQDVVVEEVAARVLDRLKIMRVFDFVGVMEAIAEIRDGLEGRKKDKEGTVSGEMVGAPEVPSQEGAFLITENQKKPTELGQVEERIIPDSQDEDDEMLLFEHEIATHTTPTAVQGPELAETEPPAPTRQAETVQQDEVIQTSFILVDNLAQVLSPLLKKDYVQGTCLECSCYESVLTSPSEYFHLSIPPLPLQSHTHPRHPDPARQPGIRPSRFPGTLECFHTSTGTTASATAIHFQRQQRRPSSRQRALAVPRRAPHGQ